MDPKLLSIHRRLDDDLPYFSEHTLLIKDKQGQMIPFVFNRAQEYLHFKLEQQRKKFGRVRAYILKGRQQGCSTYVGGRYYQKSTRKLGKSVFILSHEGKTTGKLFDIVKRFRDNAPDPIQPELAASNKNQLKFAGINSDYSVGTAGSADVGRGGTVQYFHGSEIAYWEHTDKIQTGVLQSVADLDDTEIILESTANGMSNLFYKGCMDALQGIGDYILVFIPWFWQDEYEREPEIGFALTQEELTYKVMHLKEFSEEQAIRKICWMRYKIIDLKSIWKFKQEYPATPQEAFQTSGTALISSEKIMLARKSTVTDPTAVVIGGGDPARKGDRGVIVLRRGREFYRYIVYKQPDVELKDPEAAAIFAKIIDQTGMKKFFIDVAYGYGIIDILHSNGYNQIVQGVHFSERAIENDIFLNKRAEIMLAVRDWLNAEGVSIPDDDVVQIDIQAIPDYKENSRKLIFIVPKDEIRKNCGFSPDIMDALALTFAYPVAQSIEDRRFRKKTSYKKRNSPLTTLSRVREKVNKVSSDTISMRDIYGGMNHGN